MKKKRGIEQNGNGSGGRSSEGHPEKTAKRGNWGSETGRGGGKQRGSVRAGEIGRTDAPVLVCKQTPKGKSSSVRPAERQDDEHSQCGGNADTNE